MASQSRGIWIAVVMALSSAGLSSAAYAQNGCVGECCGACSVTNTGAGSGDACDLDADCPVGESCGGLCSISGTLCTTDTECIPTGVNGHCITAGGAGIYNPPVGGMMTVAGGQVSGAGATLFVPFFRQPASTVDFIDVDGDLCPGGVGCPLADQLAPLWSAGSTTSPEWMFQYRSVGSVNGFEEFIASQTCSAIPLVVPAEAGLFNQFEYATGGTTNWVGPYGNDSGTPVQPCEIEFAFLDVPSRWGAQVPGDAKWSRTPSAPGYGLNPVPSSSGYISNLQTLDRDCGNCSISTDIACTTNPADTQSCPAGETCVPNGNSVTLNVNAIADENTLFDVTAAAVPVAAISNRGTGRDHIRYSEAQYHWGTGRFPDGENLVAITRSVGSGTRNAFINSLGIDTSWGRGDNVGDEVEVSANFRQGPATQQTNAGGSSNLEEAVINWRLGIGFTGLCGSGRAGSDQIAGLYEVLNLCRDVAYSECSSSNTPCVTAKDCPGGETCDVVIPAADCTPNMCPVTGDRQVAAPNNGYVRAGVNNLLDNCEPACSYEIIGNGSFVFRGDPDENRPGAPGSNPRIDNQAVANYINNIRDSVAAFSIAPPGDICFFQTGVACVNDSDCEVGDPDAGRCKLDPGALCNVNADCAGGATGPCLDTFCTLAGAITPCELDAECVIAVGAGSTCEPDVCRVNVLTPGEYLATTFFLLESVDCSQATTAGMNFFPNPGLNQPLQDFIRGVSNCPDPVAFGSVNPAGRVPNRVDTDASAKYSDGSSNGDYSYFNGGGSSTIASGNLSRRNLVAGDMNEDCQRTVADAAELVKAFARPRIWAQTPVAINGGGGCYGPAANGSMSFDDGIPEVLGEFNGDGSFTKEDLRYFADGLAMETVTPSHCNVTVATLCNFDSDCPAGEACEHDRKLNRKQGAIAIDTALLAEGRCTGDPTVLCMNDLQCTTLGTVGPCVIGDRTLPWADTAERLVIPPASLGGNPKFTIPADINTMKSTGQPYNAGDFRGDVAGGHAQDCLNQNGSIAAGPGRCRISKAFCDPTVPVNCAPTAPTAGAAPMGWDGRIDAVDVDYCCGQVGFDWALINDAVFADLSCDMDGDLDIDRDDITELVQGILGAVAGDADLDGDVDGDDVAIVNAGMLDACNGTLSCCWTDGDFDGDGDVDADDLPQIPAFPPTVGDDTCHQANNDLGTPCSTDADCGANVCGLKSRYISVMPTNAAVAGGTPSTIRVTVASMTTCSGGSRDGFLCRTAFPTDCPGGGTCVSSPRVGEVWWAGAEITIANTPNPNLVGAELQCALQPAQVWSGGVLHLFGTAVVPGSSYNVAMCDASGANCSTPLLVATGKWGDVVRPYGGGLQPAFGDIQAIVGKFQLSSSAPAMPRADLRGGGGPAALNTPDRQANFLDVNADIAAFQTQPYGFAVGTCP